MSLSVYMTVCQSISSLLYVQESVFFIYVLLYPSTKLSTSPSVVLPFLFSFSFFLSLSFYHVRKD